MWGNLDCPTFEKCEISAEILRFYNGKLAKNVIKYYGLFYHIKNK